MSDETRIRYDHKDAPKMFALLILDKVFEYLFYLALIFFAYNCEWCGGPRPLW